ncbi:MAG: response regulator [Deltaproteobacteria bacterium]|nr:response regulator [Deltaproteobacteria bacterium]
MDAPAAPPARILVIDDDAWILRMVTAVLEKRGYKVETAADGEAGLEKAFAMLPDLVICDVMMPRKDGWTVVKALRAQPEFAFVPVIFLSALGSDEDRIRGFKLGADDYLPKPFRFEELDLRVANAIRRRQRMEADTRSSLRAPAAEPEKPAESGVRGTLDQIGLASLLTVLEMERKSGTLTLTREHEGKPVSGKIWLARGRVVKASAEIPNGLDDAVNAQAVYALLGWGAGKFVFAATEVDVADEVKASTTHLLMEGARYLDEARRV